MKEKNENNRIIPSEENVTILNAFMTDLNLAEWVGLWKGDFT